MITHKINIDNFEPEFTLKNNWMDIEVWSCLFVINLLAFIDIMARVCGRREHNARSVSYTHFLLQDVIMIDCWQKSIYIPCVVES
jgi:hypothetical protein